MSWWKYVVDTSGTESPKAMHDKTGIDGPSFSKWKGGHVPKPDLVARFARSYGRPVLEAFVAAEFLTAAEAKVRPAGKPDYSQLTNDQLLELVRERMRNEGGGEHDRSAANQKPAPSPAEQLGTQDDYELVANDPTGDPLQRGPGEPDEEHTT